MVENLDNLELLGEMREKLSESFRLGTAVLDELSEEKRLDSRVLEEACDRMLWPSNDLRCPLEESVDTESWGPWFASLLPGLPHC